MIRRPRRSTLFTSPTLFRAYGPEDRGADGGLRGRTGVDCRRGDPLEPGRRGSDSDHELAGGWSDRGVRSPCPPAPREPPADDQGALFPVGNVRFFIPLDGPA